MYVELVPASQDMFDAWFRIERSSHAPGVAALGQRIKVHGGTFSRHRAYFVAEIAGQASIDVTLGQDDSLTP
ncbi:hypothetical protein PQQ65_33490 [Paraburkholderia strydomiana]